MLSRVSKAIQITNLKLITFQPSPNMSHILVTLKRLIGTMSIEAVEISELTDLTFRLADRAF